MKLAALISFAVLAAAAPSLAQESPPQPLAPSPALPEARDVAFPGVIALAVDATDLDRHIFKVRESIPVSGPGPMTLLYPRWLPGNHTPRGPIDQLGGLFIRANGATLAWTRDPVEPAAFHVDVPAGARSLEIEFQFLSPTDVSQGRVVMTPVMLNLQWNAVLLYPAGYFARGITVRPSVRLPDGWKYGSALDGAAAGADGSVSFGPAPLDVLVDSPLFAGRYFQQLDLDPGARVPVRLDIVADQPESLEIKPEQLAAHRAMVQQAYRLFGSKHFDHYDFLLGLTTQLGDIGLEHHRSSENTEDPEYFTDWRGQAPSRQLLPHEFTHSWNGKFRRPADLWTATYNTPMRDSLLWVYEGQTQYWGYVLAARSGLLTRQETLDAIAATAAQFDSRVGRAWKDLQDTTNDPVIANRKPLPWRSWQRSEDYYSEGELVWLDVDTLIREQSHGKKSLDDFARGFFGVDDGAMGERTYRFEDVVAGLNAVQPYDWTTFLKARLQSHGPGAPLDGLARGGYRLVYTDTPTDFFRSVEADNKVIDLTYSLGVVIGKDARFAEVLWDGPAYKAGLAANTLLVAVNGVVFDPDRLKAAIKAAKTPGSPPIQLLVRAGDRYRTVAVDYHGGLRYPRLERVEGTPARLDDILAARK